MTTVTPTMLTYIHETPKQLTSNIEHRESLTQALVQAFMKHEYQSIWIIASGSSNNASQCAKPFMMKILDCDVKVITPNTFLWSEYHMKESDFAFVISQSGCSTNSIEALDKLKSMKKAAIGVTGNLDSDFKEHSDILIDYGVGEEKVGYVTKGVVTLAQFLMLFALELGLKKNILPMNTYQEILNEMEHLPKVHEDVQKATEDFYEKHRKVLTSMSVSYACGFSQAYGIATEGALKIGETIQIPSVAYEAEEFIHGPNLQLTPSYTLFFIDDMKEGSKRTLQIYQAVREISDKCFIISNDASVDDKHALRIPYNPKEALLSPLYMLAFFQIIAHKVTTETHRWEKHPLFDKFKEKVDCKTAKIKDVMPI